MDYRKNPLSNQVLGTLRLGKDDEDERRTLSYLVNRGLSADRARQSWLDRQRLLSRLRYGVREPKTFPWRGASNISVPLIDHAIRKYKPTLMRLLTEPEPVVEFVGEDPQAVEAERLAEVFYNWLFKIKMEALEPMAYMLDTLLHRGFAFIQLGWDYRTEYKTYVVDIPALMAKAGGGPQAAPTNGNTPGAGQYPLEQLIPRVIQEFNLDIQNPSVLDALKKFVARVQAGETTVTIALQEVITDRPAVWDRDPVQMIVPSRTVDPENAEWVIVQHVFSVRTIKQLEADGFFQKGFVAQILSDMNAPRDARAQQIQGRGSEIDINFSPSLYQQRNFEDIKERIWGVENEDNILIWEIYHWFDWNSDGLADRTVTYVHPRSMSKGRSAPYPFPFNSWPFIKFDFEKTSRRWYSPRGISQLLMDFQLETNAQHNARLDAMTLRNAPVYQIPVLAGFSSRNIRAAPGTVIHTPSGAQLTPLVQDRGAYPEQVQEENLLRTLAEHYIGIFDAAITSPTSNTRARTATEISAVVQYTAATATLDAVLFQISAQKMHTMIWELWNAFGPEETFLKVTGLNPDDPDVQLLKVSKADLAKRFRLVPTGTVANTNRALELSNAREALSMYINDQSGFINPRELRAWHLGLLSQPRWTRRILQSQEQAAELQTLRAAAQALQQEPELAAHAGMSPGAPPPDQPQQEIAQSSQYGPAGQRVR